MKHKSLAFDLQTVQICGLFPNALQHKGKDQWTADQSFVRKDLTVELFS